MIGKMLSWIVGREPVATATGIAAVVTAGLGVGAAFGLDITAEQIAAIGALAAALAGWLGRSAVSPVGRPPQGQGGSVPLAVVIFVAILAFLVIGFALCGDALFEDEQEENDLGLAVPCLVGEIHWNGLSSASTSPTIVGSGSAMSGDGVTGDSSTGMSIGSSGSWWSALSQKAWTSTTSAATGAVSTPTTWSQSLGARTFVVDLSHRRCGPAAPPSPAAQPVTLTTRPTPTQTARISDTAELATGFATNSGGTQPSNHDCYEYGDCGGRDEYGDGRGGYSGGPSGGYYEGGKGGSDYDGDGDGNRCRNFCFYGVPAPGEGGPRNV